VYIYEAPDSLIFLPVSPRCKSGTEQTSIGAVSLHSILVKCEVDADPPDSVRFSWTYNNTRNVSPVSQPTSPTFLGARKENHSMILNLQGIFL